MKQPIYLQIKKDIEGKIQDGLYKAGDKIPSERELCEFYKTSRMTVRQAVHELVQENLVMKEKGRGTFIKTPQLMQKNLRSFTDTLRDQGYNPSTIVIEASNVHHLVEISKQLNVPIDSAYYKIKRLRLANEIPVALETAYIPKLYCKELLNCNLEGSLYDILEKQYAHKILNISCDLEACVATGPIMRAFGVSKPIPLLKAVGVVNTTAGIRLFYEESYYHSAVYKYHVDIASR